MGINEMHEQALENLCNLYINLIEHKIDELLSFFVTCTYAVRNTKE